MSDPSACTWEEMAKCQQAHASVEESAVGILRTLTLIQKQKLLELMQKWVANKL